MARDSLRISAAQRQRLRNLLRRARETSGGIWHRNRDLEPDQLNLRHSPMCNCTSVDARALALARNDSTAVAVSAAVSIAVAVLGVLANALDGHHMLVFGGVEYDDALGGAAGNPDALDWTTDQLTLVGHQHDLVAVLDRERPYQFAVAAVHRHRDDALAAASRSPVFERR